MHQIKSALSIVFFFMALTSSYASTIEPLPINTPHIIDLQTEASKHFRKLQKRFQPISFQPLVIIDRASFKYNVALNGLRPGLEKNYKEKYNLMRRLFLDELDWLLKPVEGWAFYEQVYTGDVQALPHGYMYSRFQAGFERSPKKEFCIVYPGHRELANEKLTTSMVSYNSATYGSLYSSNTKLKTENILTRKEHMHLNDYHEIAHCLDRKFNHAFQTGRASESDVPKNAFQRELFAETLGLLFMIKYEGATTHLIERRVHERYLYSWFAGRVAISSAMSDYEAMTGLTYAMAPALESLIQTLNEKTVTVLRQMSDEELLVLATKFTKDNTLSEEESLELIHAYKKPQSVTAGSFADKYIKSVVSSYEKLFSNQWSKGEIRSFIETENPKLHIPSHTLSESEKKRNEQIIDKLMTMNLRENYLEGYNEILLQLKSSDSKESILAEKKLRLMPQALYKSLNSSTTTQTQQNH